MEPFKGEFELYDVKTPKSGGRLLRIILESPRDADQDKILVDYKFKNVKIEVVLKGSETTKKIEGTFRVYDVDTRKLKNGNKLQIILDQMYEKEQDLICTEFKFHDIILTMEKIPDDMFENVEDPENEYEII